MLFHLKRVAEKGQTKKIICQTSITSNISNNIYHRMPLQILILENIIENRTHQQASGYYTNRETAEVAQEIFENKELRALFDVQRDMEPDDLRALHNMALALKRKERGSYDDTGC